MRGIKGIEKRLGPIAPFPVITKHQKHRENTIPLVINSEHLCPAEVWKPGYHASHQAHVIKQREPCKGFCLYLLDGLIPAVDAAFYAPSACREAYPAARLIRRRFGAVFRRFLFCRGKASLRAALTRRRGCDQEK